MLVPAIGVRVLLGLGGGLGGLEALDVGLSRSITVCNDQNRLEYYEKISRVQFEGEISGALSRVGSTH